MGKSRNDRRRNRDFDYEVRDERRDESRRRKHQKRWRDYERPDTENQQDFFGIWDKE